MWVLLRCKSFFAVREQGLLFTTGLCCLIFHILPRLGSRSLVASSKQATNAAEIKGDQSNSTQELNLDLGGCMMLHAVAVAVRSVSSRVTLVSAVGYATLRVAGASKRISADLQRCRMVSTACNRVPCAICHAQATPPPIKFHQIPQASYSCSWLGSALFPLRYGVECCQCWSLSHWSALANRIAQRFSAPPQFLQLLTLWSPALGVEHPLSPIRYEWSSGKRMEWGTLKRKSKVPLWICPAAKWKYLLTCCRVCCSRTYGYKCACGKLANQIHSHIQSVATCQEANFASSECFVLRSWRSWRMLVRLWSIAQPRVV